MSLRDYKLYLYLLVVSSISWWLVEITGLIEIMHGQIPPHSADYFSKNYTKWEMNEFGLLKNKLIADQLTHYSDDATTHITAPVMFFYNEKPTPWATTSAPPWVVNSETGILSADGTDLHLNGKVNINREKAIGFSALTINTSELKVNPQTSYAETKEWAELISPPNITTGTGMKMNYSDPIHLELLAKVKGHYETK
ncbi:MAG: LPS export ABC transporter periplasmic protein LptC [Methylococcales bacterium]|jgi:lipopolysaccharide export system protein LptC